MNKIPGSRRRDPEGSISFCSSCIYSPRYWPMHTPASAKLQKKILGVKWELGGGVVGLNLLLTFPVSRICQIFGVSGASRVRQFQNQLGFSPRGRLSREMRQRCGVASTSNAAPLAPHERHPHEAPPPASLSSAAGSAACVDGSTAASVTIKCGRVSGLRRRQQHPRQRHRQQRHRQQRHRQQRHLQQRHRQRRHPRRRHSRRRHSRRRHPRRRHPRRRTRNRKGEGERGQGGRSAWAGRKKRAFAAAAECSGGARFQKDICPQFTAKITPSPKISKNFCFF